MTVDDLDVLKAYLRIYVADEKLRVDLFQVAEAASKKAKDSETTPSDRK